jgi:hypothetical protein
VVRKKKECLRRQASWDLWIPREQIEARAQTDQRKVCPGIAKST